MKKTYLLILISFISLSAIAQGEGSGFGPDHKWTIGLGANIIDNDGLGSDKAFKTSEWNLYKYPIIFSAERKWSDLLATSFSISFNQFDKESLQDGIYTNKDLLYIALDLNGQLYFDQFLLKTSKTNDWLDAYVIAGVGLPIIASEVNGSFNTGLGLNFWVKKNWGIRLQTVGKFAFDHGDNNHSNHIQHSLSAIIRL